MARVVLSLQILCWPMALAPLALQHGFQLPQVELSGCMISFQGQRGYIVSSFPTLWSARGTSPAAASRATVQIQAWSYLYTLSWQDSKGPCQRQEGNGMGCRAKGAGRILSNLINICTSEPHCLFACLYVWLFWSLTTNDWFFCQYSISKKVDE